MPTIETTGVDVTEVTPKDVPVYSVARAVEWMRRPENAPKIERMAEQARDVTTVVARGIDREVTKVGRLFVELATDDDVLEDFKNSFLKSVFGLGDD